MSKITPKPKEKSTVPVWRVWTRWQEIGFDDISAPDKDTALAIANKELPDWTRYVDESVRVVDVEENPATPFHKLSDEDYAEKITMPNVIAKQVTIVTVIDPDTNSPVDVTIYKDPESGAMVGVDSSWIEQSGLNDNAAFYSPYNNGSIIEPEE